MFINCKQDKTLINLNKIVSMFIDSEDQILKISFDGQTSQILTPLCIADQANAMYDKIIEAYDKGEVKIFDYDEVYKTI